MPITKQIDPSRDLTIFVAGGELSFPEILLELENFYVNNKSKPSKFSIWDLRNATVGPITPYQITRVSGMVVKYSKSRKGGKTALIASQEMIFDLARIFKAETMDAVIDFKVFRDIDEAMEWLEE